MENERILLKVWERGDIR